MTAYTPSCTCTNPNHNHSMTTMEELVTTRYCPTCYDAGKRVRMERHGRAWVCPRQRDEERTISAALRARIVDTASKRIEGLPF